jgi:hypothetical protein
VHFEVVWASVHAVIDLFTCGVLAFTCTAAARGHQSNASAEVNNWASTVLLQGLPLDTDAAARVQGKSSLLQCTVPDLKAVWRTWPEVERKRKGGCQITKGAILTSMYSWQEVALARRRFLSQL